GICSFFPFLVIPFSRFFQFAEPADSKYGKCTGFLSRKDKIERKILIFRDPGIGYFYTCFFEKTQRRIAIADEIRRITSFPEWPFQGGANTKHTNIEGVFTLVCIAFPKPKIKDSGYRIV